ncbi:MAG: nucleotidyltransferase domain-containing protein [Nostochopsis sp.]
MTTLIQAQIKEPTATKLEIELLLCCARASISPETAERIKTLLQQQINWTYLIKIADIHGAMPLLYQNLKTICPEAVPVDILAQLRHRFHANALHNHLLTQELLKLLSLLQEHNICAVPFKGPVLAASAYGNLSLRQFGDIDILVHKQDYSKAKELLMADGYSMLHDSEHEGECLQAQMWNIVRQVNVDLHYGIPPQQFHFDTEGFWERLQPFSLYDTTILTLSPEDHISILCINWYKGHWRKLSDICDIAAMVCAHPKMDWPKVLEQVQRWRIRRILYIPLCLARDVLETPLPEEILSTIKIDPVSKWLSSQFSKNYLLKNEGLIANASLTPSDTWLRALYNLLISEYKHKMILYWLTPKSKDREFVKIPNSMSWLYYFVGPIRLINKFGLPPVKYIFQRLRHRE